MYMWTPAAVRVEGGVAMPNLDKMKIEIGKGEVFIKASHLKGNGETVTIHWRNVDHVSQQSGHHDFIAAYAPEPKHFNKTAPTKWKFVHSDKSGSGSTKLFLLNQRAPWRLAYFTGGLDSPVMRAISNPIPFDNFDLPLQIHLALRRDPTQMVVSWNTLRSTAPAVRYGLAKDALNHTASASLVLTSTYSAKDMCGPPATKVGFNTPVGLLHSALLTGLRPSTRYYYQIVDEKIGAKANSKVLSFYAPPMPTQKDMDFAIFGDMGQAYQDGSKAERQIFGSLPTTHAIIEDINGGHLPLAHSPAVFHIGDVSYARGFASVWENWFHQIQPVSQSVPWMVAPGNHERDWPNSGSFFNGKDSGGECGVPLEKRFLMPTPTNTQEETRNSAEVDSIYQDDGDYSAPFTRPNLSGPSKAPSWWSVDYGSVHVIMMSTEHDIRRGSAQWKWIEKDLSLVNRTKTPFVIFAGHRPAYVALGKAEAKADALTDINGATNSTENYHDHRNDFDQSEGDEYSAESAAQSLEKGGAGAGLRAALEDLWHKYRVDVCLWGHIHLYQRTCAIYKSKCVAAPKKAGGFPGTVHIVTGAAGAGSSSHVPKQPPSWLRFMNVNAHGYTHAYVRDNKLTLDFVTMPLKSKERKVLDSVTINKQKFANGLDADVDMDPNQENNEQTIALA